MFNPIVMTKLMVTARRSPLTRTPAEVGLDSRTPRSPRLTVSG